MFVFIVFIGIAISILADCGTKSCFFKKKMWSIRVELLHVVLLGQFISCLLNPHFSWSSVYLLMSSEFLISFG